MKVGRQIKQGGTGIDGGGTSSAPVRGTTSRRRRGVAITAAAAAVLGGLAFATVPAEAQVQAATPAAQAQAVAPDGVRAATLYKKHVKSTTREVTVFKSPTGSDSWGVWGPCTNFWTDRTDGSRYHTWIADEVDAWVTSDSRYVASGWC